MFVYIYTSNNRNSECYATDFISKFTILVTTIKYDQDLIYSGITAA